jgi:hypothetical protein
MKLSKHGLKGVQYELLLGLVGLLPDLINPKPHNNWRLISGKRKKRGKQGSEIFKGRSGRSCCRFDHWQRREVFLIGRWVRQAQMRTFAVVELKVFANGAPGVADRLVGSQINLFLLDAAPHALDERMSARGAFAVHRQSNASAQHRLGECYRRELAALSANRFAHAWSSSLCYP